MVRSSHTTTNSSPIKFAVSKSKDRPTSGSRARSSSFFPSREFLLTVQAAKFMADMENTPIHGSIIAVACGLGKTLTTLMTIFYQALQTKEWNRTHPPDQQMEYDPSLILTPSPSIEVWLADIEKLMPSTFTVHTFFGHRNKKDGSKKTHQIVSPSNVRRLNEIGESCKPTEFQVSLPAREPEVRRIYCRLTNCSRLALHLFFLLIGHGTSAHLVPIPRREKNQNTAPRSSTRRKTNRRNRTRTVGNARFELLSNKSKQRDKPPVRNNERNPYLRRG